MYLFVPSAGSCDRRGTWLFVMIYLTEQCNRHTVQYSLVGKQSMLCVLLVCEGHSQSLWCCPSFPHCSFFRGHSLIDSSERHLGICSLLFGTTVLQKNNIKLSFDVHSLRLDLFQSLLWAPRLRLRWASLYKSLYLSLCLQSTVKYIQYLNIYLFSLYAYIHYYFCTDLRTDGFIFFHKGCYYNGGLLPHLFA